MSGRSLHRPYLWMALANVSLGAPLGLLLLAVLTGWAHTHAWRSHVVAHAQFQVFGFVVIFTLGMALQLLAPTSVSRPWSLLSLLLLAGGTLLASFAGLFPWLAAPGAALQVAGLAVHARLFWKGQRWHGCSLGYFLSGQLWLALALVSGRPDLVLWGFACLYILGVGWRMHPRMLGCRRPPEALQRAVLVVWNVGLALACPALLAATALVVFLVWGRASQGLWLRGLYAVLMIAPLLPLGLARHALTTGFVVPMMIGMTLELLPAFARRPVPRRLRASLVLALVAATALRLSGQAARWSGIYLLGGCAQLAVLSAFVMTLGLMLIQRSPRRITVEHAT